MKKFAIIIFVLLCLFISGCQQSEKKVMVDTPQQSKIYAVMETDKGNIKIELYPDTAPNTVINFITLANQGFFNGLKFFKIQAGSFILTGDPKNDGTGGPGYTIPDEISPNINHVMGSVGMVKGSQPDSAGSQFYICLTPQPAMDGNYTIFGRITEGLVVCTQLREKDQINRIRIQGELPESLKNKTLIKSRENVENMQETMNVQNPRAIIKTEKGTIIAELYPANAPNTVLSFVTLAKSGFYNGLIFHRVVPGFVIQGGDPTGTGRGGPGYSIPAEISLTLRHNKGSLAMARSQHLDSAGSQFYICLDKQPTLDGKYTVFGQVLEGMDVCENIQMGDKIESITIQGELPPYLQEAEIKKSNIPRPE